MIFHEKVHDFSEFAMIYKGVENVDFFFNIDGGKF